VLNSTGMTSRVVFLVGIAALLLCPVLGAKEKPAQILDWPVTNPILRFTITKVRQVGSYGGQNTYVLETEVQNLSQKRISRAGFTFYLFDKKQIRISDGYITVSNVGPGEVVKMQLTAGAMGIPASMSVSPTDLPPELQQFAPPKTVSVNITSVPSDAKLTVDGKAEGTTPIALNLTVGSHKLEFSKEGFSTGRYPLTIAPDQLPGGTVSFELGGTTFDTVDLRDGTVVNGEVESVDATSVVVRVGGGLQNFDRNLVKRILFVEREEPKAASQPNSQQP
jgi:hypothetical protein